MVCSCTLETESSTMRVLEVHCCNNCGCYSVIPLTNFRLIFGGICVADYITQGLPAQQPQLSHRWMSQWHRVTLHSVYAVLAWMTLRSLSSLQFTIEQLARHVVVINPDNQRFNAGGPHVIQDIHIWDSLANKWEKCKGGHACEISLAVWCVFSTESRTYIHTEEKR